MKASIVLRFRHFFSQELKHETNMPSLRDCVFKYQGGAITVWKGDKELFYFDGATAGSIDGKKFTREWKRGEQETLVGEDFSIVFPEKNRKTRDVYTIDAFSTPDNSERYVLALKRTYRTTVTVEHVGEQCDPGMMVACLAFQWSLAEMERNWT